jgi:hypothetical protein
VRGRLVAFVVLASAAPACGDSNGGGASPGASGGKGGRARTVDVRASGGESTDAGDQQTSLIASAYGRITVVGSSPALPNASRTFFGPSQGGATGSDFVLCSVHAQRDAQGPPRVDLVAGTFGQQQAETLAWFAIDSTDPFTREYTFDEARPSQSLGALVRMHDSPLLIYEYQYGADLSLVPQIRSSCSVAVTTISATRLVGSLECRDLLATTASPDSPGAGLSPPRASATISFDCIPEIQSAAPGAGAGGAPATGGVPSVAGAGGSFSIGGAPSAGGIGGVAGAIGGGGNCRGSASPCSLLPGSDCALALGCSKDGSCDGVATSCYSEFDDYSCTSQEGCYWTSSSRDCSGSARSCSSFSGSGSCSLQDGCRWSESCTGSAWSCNSISTEPTCRAQPGCYWLN